MATFTKLLESQPELLTLPGPGNAWPWAYLLSWVIPVGLGWPMQPQMWLKMHIPRSVTYIRLWPLWVTISFPVVMGAAFLTGMTGQVVQPGLTEREATDTVMISLLLEYFPAIVGGLVAAAGLAAMMSTVSSQIHSVGASVARDFLAQLFPDQEPRQQVWLARLAVIVVGFVGLYLSLTQPACSPHWECFQPPGRPRRYPRRLEHSPGGGGPPVGERWPGLPGGRWCFSGSDWYFRNSSGRDSMPGYGPFWSTSSFLLP